jgi:uncharacterized protein (DUF849 family)
MVEACLNGSRSVTDHPGVPLTPAALAASARACVAAGATDLHVHPRDACGAQSLGGPDVTAAVVAIREAVPGVPVGVSTLDRIAGSRTVDLVRQWPAPPVGPDFASVNWHEPAAPLLAAVLHDRRIGVQVGLFTAEAAVRFLAGGLPAVRVLVEAVPGVSPGEDGVAAARAVLAALGSPDPADVVVHGEDAWAWPVLRWAAAEGWGIRAGLEDMLAGPDGEPVDGNGELVAYAVAVDRRASGRRRGNGRRAAS